ncbi:hypothetical protein K2173_000254 [Erythroxylum novogranatense]|uniref:Adenylate isopentenyltransferase n=1 Tax=Erythroxylum novogranatense TaxID=1862640 RepID=A0AAV8SW33_9ROSI|nr:hypothetical protein K2173_000254 [Erythroxylum novogranatense]
MKLSFNIIPSSSHYYSSAFPRQLHFLKPSRPHALRGVRMDSSSSTSDGRKDKIVVIMGATGCGKSKLSIDLATRLLFHRSEIINSDKMQVYNGLDITTNKIPLLDRRRVPHHLLGDFDPNRGEFTPYDFRLAAGLAISDIVSRQKVPIVVGGSNSFIHALVVDRFDPDVDVFNGADPHPGWTELRYKCCFIWVDVSFSVLCDYLCKRVDEMLETGMLEELAEYHGCRGQPGLRKAIGVPEFDPYLDKYPPGRAGNEGEWDLVRIGAYEKAVREIKENTCELAKRQIGKIMRLKGAGWDLQRVEATEAFREVLLNRNGNIEAEKFNNNNTKKNRDYRNIDDEVVIKKRKKKRKKKRWTAVWEREVVEASVKIVKRFLEE